MQKGSIVQKGNAIYAVYRLPSGKQRWEATGSGAKGRKAAKQHLAEVLGEIAKEGYAYREPKNAAFDDFCDRFLEQNSYRYKASTLATYRRIIEARLKPYFGHSSMRRSLSVEGCIAFTNYLLSEGVSIVTTNHILTILSAVCSWAVKVDVLPRNPLKQVIRPKDPHEFQRAVLAPEKIQQVILCTPKGWKRNLVVLAAHTAMRAGELAALKSGSVDFNSSELVVSATTWKRVVRDSPKNGKTRRVPMSAAVQAAVRDQLASRTPNTRDLLFCGAQGATLDMSVVGQEVLQPALKRAGIVLPEGQDTWMVFRHSTISYWCASGMPPATISSISGHRIETLYKHYLHSVPQDRHKVATLMDALSSEGQTVGSESRTA